MPANNVPPEDTEA